VRLYYEWGATQLRKHGEELCGDSLVLSRRADSVTLALADGLGSGVKANILSTLTAKIAVQLLENDLPLRDVVETIGQTLPVCQVRKLAYSTFAIAQFFSDGHVRIVEFDTPPAILLRDRHRWTHSVSRERVLGGKNIRETAFFLKIGDWVVLVSDGVLNAGIGGVYPLGWGLDQATQFLERHAHPNLGAQELADKMAAAVQDLYAGRPGDDVSIVVFKVRHKLAATVLTGPPEDRKASDLTVDKFLSHVGRHVVCGGTTAQLVARRVNKPVDVDLATMTDEVPAMARIDGMDLVTEGILTLTRARALLSSGIQRDAVRFKTDGASALVRMFLSADHVHFMVGMAKNPAHQNPELPQQLGIRLAVVREIAEALRHRGIEATVETV